MNPIWFEKLIRQSLLPLAAAAGMLLAGCARQPSYTPLSEDTMREVLIDLHLADAVVEVAGGTMNQRDALRDSYTGEILEQRGLDRETFLLSYQYYVRRPEEMNRIYEQVIAALDKRLQEEQFRQPNRPPAEPPVTRTPEPPGAGKLNPR
ncbi:MAG: DUF4296 domain-containing protein [Bacteroidia bacterium]|nr:DUF4296 domain-containing protein [Bacteroidia bacterium]